MAQPEADEAVHVEKDSTAAFVFECLHARARDRRRRDVHRRRPRRRRRGPHPRRSRRARARRSPSSQPHRLSGADGVERFTHGTTIATNALLERRGARTAFVTNEGFEHLLHLRRQTRAHLYRPCAEHPPPLVPLERCVGVRGRTGPCGRARAARPRRRCPTLDADAIAVCLLFSFRDTEPERAVAAEIRRRYPAAHVVASHEVAPGVPRVRARLDDGCRRVPRARALPLPPRARGRVRAAGLPEPLVMRSSGGVATLDEAAAHAAFALLSGPAAGVVGAAQDRGARRVRERALLRHGRHVDGRLRDRRTARRGASTNALVGGLPVRLPTLAVHTVGAGGGSIVRLDEGGALRVGPGERGRRSRPGVLRPRRHAGDRDGREPPARPPPGALAGRHRARRRAPPSRRSAASTRPP